MRCDGDDSRGGCEVEGEEIAFSCIWIISGGGMTIERVSAIWKWRATLQRLIDEKSLSAGADDRFVFPPELKDLALLNGKGSTPHFQQAPNRANNKFELRTAF